MPGKAFFINFRDFPRFTNDISGRKMKILSTPSCRASRVLLTYDFFFGKIFGKFGKFRKIVFPKIKNVQNSHSYNFCKTTSKSWTLGPTDFPGFSGSIFRNFPAGNPKFAKFPIFYKKAHWVVLLTIRA